MSDRARLIILFCSTMLMTLSFIGLRMDVPLLALKLGASPFLIGVLMSAFAILPVFLAVHAGRWIDAVGIVGPMIASAGAMAACLVLVSALPSLWILFLVNAITGIGSIAFHLALTAATGAIGRPEDRTANFSWITVANGVGIFAGPVITGHLVDAIGHSLALAALAIPPALVACFIGTLRSIRQARPRRASHSVLRGIRELIALPELVRILIIAAVLGVGWDLYALLVPIYGSSIGLQAGMIGNVMGAFGVSVFVVRLLVPFMLRFMSEWQIVVTALFMCAPVFMLIPLATGPGILMLLTFTFGIAWGAVQPILTSLLYGASPGGRIGEVSGVRMTLHTALQLVMPTLFGTLSVMAGMIPVFWSVGGVLLVSGWLVRGRWRARR